MRYEYDSSCEGLYLYLHEIEPGAVARTVDFGVIAVDLDATGKVLGVDVIDPLEDWDVGLLAGFELTGEETAYLTWAARQPWPPVFTGSIQAGPPTPAVRPMGSAGKQLVAT